MCGFLTEFAINEYELPLVLEEFETLLALSKNRGPDSTEILTGDYYRLGFNRLSILDLSENGNQPLTSPSGRYHVVFNGEIYNYRELAETYKFTNLRSHSDSEVLVHLLDTVGINAAIKALNGMFAISIVDTSNETLILTRDFAGIKPLFYGLSDKGVVAASQFNQVFKHFWFKDNLQLCPQAVKSYFGFGYMQDPQTVFQNIYQVEPGELVKIDSNGKLDKTQLVVFNDTDKCEDMVESHYLEQLEVTLDGAVNRQLVSDVPLATFLSGGVDSPLVSALAKRHKPNIKSFTVAVQDPNLNELAHAQKYAQELELDQEVRTVTASSLLQQLDAHFEAYPEPFGDYSSIPTFMITQMAKQEHTVMLSGDGGDELFFGYPRMLDVLNKRLWFFLPYALRTFLVRVTNKLGLTNTWSPFFKSFGDFVMNKHLHLPKVFLDTMMPDINFSDKVQKSYQFSLKLSRKKLLNDLRKNEFYNHLQRILIKVDRASMQHGLEVRVPLLDKSVIELAWHGCLSLKHKTALKQPLKALLSNYVPKANINQNKMGFTVPLHDWLHKELKKDVITTLQTDAIYGQDILNVLKLREYVTEYYEGKHDNAWGIWHLYAWQKWAKQEELL